MLRTDALPEVEVSAKAFESITTYFSKLTLNHFAKLAFLLKCLGGVATTLSLRSYQFVIFNPQEVPRNCATLEALLMRSLGQILFFLRNNSLTI